MIRRYLGGTTHIDFETLRGVKNRGNKGIELGPLLFVWRSSASGTIISNLAGLGWLKWNPNENGGNRAENLRNVTT